MSLCLAKLVDLRFGLRLKMGPQLWSRLFGLKKRLFQEVKSPNYFLSKSYAYQGYEYDLLIITDDFRLNIVLLLFSVQSYV